MSRLKDSAKLSVYILLLLLPLSVEAQRQPRDGGAGPARGVQPGPSIMPGERHGLARAPRYPKVDKRTVTFKSRSQLVLVPVVVKSKEGRHLPGLTKEQFLIYEDGKPQRVTQFEEISRVTNAPVVRPSVPEGVYTNLVTRDATPRQLAIVMLDMLNTPLPDQARARDELLKYLARTVDTNTPTALLILTYKGVRVLHDFAVEPKVLADALQKASNSSPETHVPTRGTDTSMRDLATSFAEPRAIVNALEAAAEAPGRAFRQANAIQATMEAFQHVAQSFAGVPGRKALIWATASFPFNVMEDTGIVGQGQPSSLYERTMQMLANANVAVYPVDVRGLVVFGGAGEYDEGSHSATLSTMEMFAEMTGGRAFYNRNDLNKSFQEATEDSSSYYLLGYQLDTSNDRSGWRKLKVEVQQPGARVRARTGFFVTPVTEDPEYSRKVDIWNALQSPLDYTSLNFVVRWTEIVESGDRIRAKFQINLPPDAVVIDFEDKNRVELEFLGVARDSHGESAGEFSQTFTAKLKPDDIDQVRRSGITYNQAIEVPRGQYTVRFVVRDNNSGRTGSVRATLTSEMASKR